MFKDDLSIKKKVLDMIMQWCEEEELEDLRRRKGPKDEAEEPKAVAVEVLSVGKPSDREEGDEDEDEVKGKLKRLFKND